VHILGSYDERKHAINASLAHVGTVLADQMLHDLTVALLGCHEQGSGPVRRSLVDVSTELNQAVQYI
jgi:hypothetical protein